MWGENGTALRIYSVAKTVLAASCVCALRARIRLGGKAVVDLALTKAQARRLTLCNRPPPNSDRRTPHSCK